MSRRPNRTRKFLLGNLGALGILALLALSYFFLFYRPSLINRAFPVSLPAARAVGESGEALRSAGLELTVMGLKRLDALDYQGQPLSSRARPDPLTEYLVLEVAARNTANAPLSLGYAGEGQRLEFLLGSRRPQPQVSLAALPRDAEIITGQAPLPSRTLEPGERVSGVVVFPVRRTRQDLSLLVLSKPSQRAVDKLPSFEVALSG